jgi:hypothetical protein
VKTCNHCSTELKLGTNWQENRKKVYINLCDDCYKTRQKKYQKERQSNPEKLRKQREYRIKRDYGISMGEFEACMATSNCCEICGFIPSKKPAKNSTNRSRSLVYDHCHDSMKFRGVLCDSCNTAIGKLGDTVEGIQRAINYLQKSGGRVVPEFFNCVLLLSAPKTMHKVIEQSVWIDQPTYDD